MKFLKNLSRRGMLGATAAAASALPVLAQAPAPAGPPGAAGRGGAPGAAGRGAGGGRGGAPGGSGPIRVLFTSSYHPFDRENLFRTLDGFGQDITWSHIEHPAAEAFYDPKLADRFDVFLFYDAFAGRPNPPPPRAPAPPPPPAGAPPAPRPAAAPTPYRVPTAEEQANLKALLQAGNKGFVFFHHSIASWVHSWPAGINGSNAYVEVMGAAADWGEPLKNIRGVDYPPSGFKKQPQHVTVVDKNHPVTAGVDDFDIVDESYLCPMFEDSVHPLIRTNIKQVVESYTPRQAGHPPGSNMCGWYKASERTPVVYIQHGHDNDGWSNPSFQKLLLNAIKWTASPEAKTWAHANPQRIFK